MPEHVERAHLAEDRRVGVFVAEHLEHARRQLVLAVGARGVAHHAFFVGQLLFEEERVAPVETGFGFCRHDQRLAGVGGAVNPAMRIRPVEISPCSGRRSFAHRPAQSGTAARTGYGPNKPMMSMPASA